ncbi:MAG TPA: AsmA family protein [Terriglobales bacterium]|nr:AsmA family protein [Terriglobales bacterium]
MKKLRSKRVIGSIALLLLALFLVRPQSGLLHRKVAESLSMELGRRVEIAAVHIRFLPRPGLDLENLTIYDNPEFGAEPLLRSPDVSAWLRMSSLLRRRIEISSLDLNDASLNLSRNSDGKWNFEELVERASKSSTAPTAAGKREPRRIFPYIEAGRARINFKDGLEKTHFAFTNAEFSLWQESENQWGMRLRGSPIRTDANLTDTGIISMSGVWQRAAVLYDTPFQFSLEWKQAQIGQMSRLFFGTDEEWRGSAALSGHFSGTLRNLKITSEASIDQLRRQDLPGGADFSVAAQCSAEYNADQRFLTNLDCNSPTGDGSLELKGSATGIPFSSYNLTLLAKDAPVQSALNLLRHVNQTVPRDLNATGNMDLTFSFQRSSSAAVMQMQGEGEARDVRLSSHAGSELILGRVPFALVTAPSTSKIRPVVAPLNFPKLQIGPINITLGRPMPIQARLSISRLGYTASIRGEAGLNRLLQAAQTLRLPAPKVTAEGIAALELNIFGGWDSGTPTVAGTTQLRSVHAQVRGMNSPLQIRRADLTIDADVVRVKNLDALAAESTWRGSLSIPRPCATPETCRIQFHLRTAQASAAALNRLLNPMAAKHPWYKILEIGSSSNYFAKVAATGSVAIDKLKLGGAVCTGFFSNLDLEKARLSLMNTHGSLLSGEATGDFKADFSVRPPEYSGAGNFDGISLSSISKFMRTGWIDGEGSANYRFKTAGWKLQDLFKQAELDANFSIKDSEFPHVVLSENAEPLHSSAFSGQLTLRDGIFSLDNAELVSESGVFNVSGTASLAGDLDFKMTGENTTGYNVSGTLDQPRVSPITNPPTQAALKP